MNTSTYLHNAARCTVSKTEEQTENRGTWVRVLKIEDAAGHEFELVLFAREPDALDFIELEDAT